jgi:hypothetical protein
MTSIAHAHLIAAGYLQHNLRCPKYPMSIWYPGGVPA